MEHLCFDVARNLSENSSKSINPVQNQDWEYDMIGEFLLKLFHQNVISINKKCIVLKNFLREEFKRFLELAENLKFKIKLQTQNGPANDLGSLLYRTNFLINTPRGSKYYHIKYITLFQYGNKKLKILDEQRQNIVNFVMSSNNNLCQINESIVESMDQKDEYDPEFLECLKSADNSKYYSLEYQGTSFERRDDDFSLSSMGCFICLRNFSLPEEFEEHIQWHGEDSDFESLKKMRKLEKAFFNLSYNVCKDSHYFCFILSTNEQHVIIEKIIIVRTRSMFFVNNNRVPYAIDKSGVDKFFVDSHLFNISVEQPVIIIFRYKSNEAMRVVEQHHFMRAEEFPEVNFSINGNRLPNRIMFKPKITLLQYLPPIEIKKALKQKYSNKTLADISNEFSKYFENNRNITADTMIQVWNLLLQIEDMDVIKNFECLVQRKVKLRKFGNEYSLQLNVKRHIFIENILSQYDEVLIFPENSEVVEPTFDYIKTCIAYNAQKKKNCHNGIVERISNNRVVIMCYTKLSEKDLYKVIFRPARLTLRYQYRALQLLSSVPNKLLQRYFFPDINDQAALDRIQIEVNLFNANIADNCEQLDAVRNIANGPVQSAPYIIFGPPGTGKTTVLVEAILQLYKYRPLTKILVTAGSNNACDEIAMRLCKFLMRFNDPRAMVRIYAKSNEKRQDNINEELLDASNMYGAHFYPDINVLHEYRIVICTLSVVGTLATGYFGKTATGNDIFTHTFVDEVAASTATEVLVGISSTISPINHLIISGDHKQLGPILQSNKAKELGLGLSLMEHLLTQECYRIDEFGNYNRSIQTRLRRNHRSHKVIVNLYSKLYYENQLIPLAKQDDVKLAFKWHHLPNPHYPVIFHSVFGQSMRGKSDVSLYNDKELEVVLDYVKDLIYFGIHGEKIKESDIGIISPYRKQYLRIQEELNSRRLYGIETGSVETFQGKEKHIVIVSFVRSFTDKLGFLDNPRRLNVTLSRAKSLLILIGNPKTLANSADFKQIITLCKNNNTMVGATVYEDPSSSIVSDNKSELTEKCDNTNDKKNRKQRIRHRHNKSNGERKNKISKAPRESKQENNSNEKPKLGKHMKNCVNTISQKKRLHRFEKFGKKQVEKDGYNMFQGKKTSNIDVEKVFNSIPKANFKSQQPRESPTSKRRDDLRIIENEIHDKMRKLRLKIPQSTNSSNIISDGNIYITSTISTVKSTFTSNLNEFPSENQVKKSNNTDATSVLNAMQNITNANPSTYSLNREEKDIYYASSNAVPLNLLETSGKPSTKPTTHVSPTLNTSQMGVSKLSPRRQSDYGNNDIESKSSFAPSDNLQRAKKEKSCILA